MRQDLLEQISKESGITDVLILTHNIDFVFLQTVALARLRSCGDPNITVFADAGCAMESFSRQKDSLVRLSPHKRLIGAAYRVVSVMPPAGFRFHPKAVLLAGKEHAVLFVGSGNLTFGGWRENGEVWSRFDTRDGGTGVFAAFRKYLDGMLPMIAQPDLIRPVIDRAFDASDHSWAKRMETPAGLVGRPAQGRSMLDTIRALIPEAVDRITVCAPYFDPTGRALQELSRMAGPAGLRLFVPDRDSNLTEAAVASVAGLEPVSICFRQPVPLSEEHRDGFVHAKFIAFHSGSQVTLFSGSGNCSYAALLASGNSGNAELYAVHSMTEQEFERDLLSELTISPDPPRQAEMIEPDESATPAPRLSIAAARYSGGHLRISYLPANAEINACLVDGVEVDLATGSVPGEITLEWEIVSSTVVLHGRIDADEVVSPPLWIDHEAQLSVSARDREIRRQIGERVRAGVWGLDAWNSILDTLVKQMAQQSTGRFGIRPAAGTNKKDREVTFNAADVAVDGFSLPTPLLQSMMVPGADRIGFLRRLLLRWLGVSEEEPRTDVIDSPAAEEGDADAAGEQLYGDAEVTPPKAAPPTTTRQLLQAERVVRSLADTVCSEPYLIGREPELLAGDIALSSALLRTALKEEWITQDLFIESTLRIWYTLFLSSDLDATKGWIECRMAFADNPEEFKARMQSPQVAAALALWIIALPSEVASSRHSLLLLAAVISVARLPWLWHDVERDSLAAELAEMVEATAHGEGWGVEWEEIQERWRDLMNSGSAFGLLDRALGEHTPVQLSNLVDLEDLSAGEILWQAARNGFCVVQDAARRRKGIKVNVYRLQNGLGAAEFAADFTVPVRSLMISDRSPVAHLVSAETRASVLILLAALQQGFATDLEEQRQKKGGRVSDAIAQFKKDKEKLGVNTA